jgi:hypothetical protein
MSIGMQVFKVSNDYEYDYEENLSNIINDNAGNNDNIISKIFNLIENSENIIVKSVNSNYGALPLKPHPRVMNMEDELWNNVKEVVNTPTFRPIILQSSWNYTFYLYNSPKHGLLEVVLNNNKMHIYREIVSSNNQVTLRQNLYVNRVTYKYLCSTFRMNEYVRVRDLEMFLSSLLSGYNSEFLENTIVMTDELKDFLETPEIKAKIDAFVSRNIEFEALVSEELEINILDELHVYLGKLDDEEYYLAKVSLISEMNSKEYIVLFSRNLDSYFTYLL